MVKLIGLIMIASGILAFFAWVYIDYDASTSPTTGNIIMDVLAQPDIPMTAHDYLAGLVFSYSIASFIIGSVFLFKIS